MPPTRRISAKQPPFNSTAKFTMINIRKFVDNDFDRIKEVYGLSKLDELSNEPNTFELVPLDTDTKRLYLFNQSDIFVYESDGKLLGFCGNHGGHITWLYVHPEFRGQGLAIKLLTYLIPLLKGRITLNVTKSNKAAIALYEKMGFSIIKEMQGSYDGTAVTVNEMELKGVMV